MSSRTNVAHYNLSDTAFHINYRLAGSIAQTELLRMQLKREEASEQMQEQLDNVPAAWYKEAYRQEQTRLQDFTESLLETALHTKSYGPRHLDQPALRALVMNSWLYLHTATIICLHALCIMSNHVHVVLSAPEGKQLDTGRLIRQHKSYTARRCNVLLGQRGTSFWAKNYFDRTIRQGAWLTTMWYMLNNPVKAKLVSQWSDWPGTYVNPLYASHFS